MSTPSLQIMLRTLRLPSVLANYQGLAETAASNNWGFEQYLHTLLEVETQDRSRRRTTRLLKQSGLPDGKTLDNIEMSVFPQKIRRTVPTLLDGGFVERAENILAFGLPGRGKTHLLVGVAYELIVRHNYRVLFTTTFSLVQRLLVAKRELRIEELLRKLDRYDVILLDDIGYVQQTREEMEILFTFLSERYERRSLMITSNLMFSEWDKIFKDPMTTLAAIDRLVHHSTVLELDCESWRANQAIQRQKGSK
ncbi:MAG: IS21-like element helper ATPase IstB [Lentisphaeria bacterium]|nr:IS21-like element helper ATPase IstB [Lentisphaeria bacterium]